MNKYDDMMKEYKANGGKVTQCPTKYNNNSVSVRPKKNTKVLHYRRKTCNIKPIGVCKENKAMRYY